MVGWASPPTFRAAHFFMQVVVVVVPSRTPKVAVAAASVAPAALSPLPRQMGWTAEVAVVGVPAQRLVTVRVVTAARVLSSFVTRERAKRH